MKKLSTVILFALLGMLLPGCRKALKNVEDYYPVLETVSATVNSDGTVKVTARVESEGGSPLEYIGFCMDTLPVPDMMSNQQVLSELMGNEFSTNYVMNFNPAKTYYFRSWASNSTGYAYGNVISLTNIRATPVEAPCALNKNSSNIGANFSSGSGPENSVYKVTTVDHFSSTWDITCTGYSSGAGTLIFKFGSALNTKVYTTTTGNAYGDRVYINISSGFMSGQVKDGAKVYVNQKSTGVYEITVCDADWTVDGTSVTYKLNARFVSPF